MNTSMWEHPLTAKHVELLSSELGYKVIMPIAKKLVCGDVGMGAMASVDSIVEYVVQTLGQ